MERLTRDEARRTALTSASSEVRLLQSPSLLQAKTDVCVT
jgi:hypothetical protein